MRINEYQSLAEFIDEYSVGTEMPWDSREGKRRYMGIEFSYNGIYYRMCREPGPDDMMPILQDGRIGRYDVMIMHNMMDGYQDDDIITIGWYSDLNDVLETCMIGGK